jgi:M6 family metalloprotease-like protein
MNKLKTIILCVSALIYFNIHAQRSNCSAFPKPVKVKQPNGKEIDLKILGNEVLHYYQTLDGYTVLQNSEHNGAYEYATLNANADIVASGVQVGENFGKQAMVKGLKPSKVQIANAYKRFMGNIPAQQFSKSSSDHIFPSTGKRKLLVVLVQFPDEQSIYTKESFERLTSEVGYNDNGCAGSFRDYYLANSYGQLDLDVTVVGWYTAAQNKINYGKTNLDGSDNNNYNSNVQELVAQCIDSAEAEGIDFSDYDNDGDGEMDGLVIFHSGYGAEEGKNGYIWSHRWSLWGGNNRFYDGVNIRDYCINPSKRDLGVGLTQVRIGVVSHEFGHVLGLPDLYDTDQTSEGAGNWCLMAGAGWLNSESTPGRMNAWCKTELGWLTPTIISSKKTYFLPNVTDSNIAFRMNTPLENEYFLFENRQQKKWDRYMPGKGMAVWHIDSDIADQFRLFGGNSVNTDTANYGVGLVQADGLREFERNINRGNSGDVYPGSTNNKLFTNSSVPSSQLYKKDNSGNKLSSNINIINITLRTDSVITFDITTNAKASFIPSTKKGCAPLTVNFNNTSIFSNSYQWDFGNGITSTQQNANHTYTQPGTYKASLVVYDEDNLPVDTVETTIVVNASPKAIAEVTRDGNKIIFTNKSEDAVVIQWGLSNGFSTRDNTFEHNYTQPITYTLDAYNNSCSSQTSGSLFSNSINEITQNNIGLIVFPNPAETETFAAIDLKESSNVTITSYNILGERVFSQQEEIVGAGKHQIAIDKHCFPSQGLYLIKVQAGNQSGLQRIVKN